MSAPAEPAATRMYLVPVAGPALDVVEIAAKPGGATIGRHQDCDVLLPADADRVSRFHARLDASRDGLWSIVDLSSRWGTAVNGVKLAAEVPVPLNEGDLIRLSPFTFLFSSTPRRRGLQASRDAGGPSHVRTLGTITGGGADSTGIVDQMLHLLLNSAEQVHASTDEVMLAERLMDAALTGSGLTNAAVLRPTDRDGHFEVVASRFAGAHSGETVRFSQSLIDAASHGQAAELSGGGIGDDVSRSIVQMNIGSALCVPLMLGSGDGVESTVAAYLYLDSRGMMAGNLRPQAREFCIALGRMASLSLANLKRLDIEKRQARLESEIKAAAKMQSWMLPQRNTTLGPPDAKITCIGESRFGQMMGGDFFDLIDLGDGKVAVTIGDVSGKGVTASVMMTATHGYLHAALRDFRSPELAVSATQAFIVPRRPTGKFVTAWVGVIDLQSRTLKYVDAGHGYALLQSPDGHCEVLQGAGGPPIGMIDEATYDHAEIAMPRGSRLLLMSDGIIEQFGMVPTDDGKPTREQFEVSRVIDCLLKTKDDADPVNCLFDALIQHAGSRQLGDDATIVWVKT
jgi:phosphoserine phosphatase RsbU/P